MNSKQAESNVRAPKTTMVYCPPCMRHWEAPANEDWWNARVELCPKHQAMEREEITDADLDDAAKAERETTWPT